MRELETYLAGYRKYQAFVYGLLFIPCFLSGAWTLVFTFTGAVPENRCCIASLGECGPGSNASYERFGNKSTAEFRSWYFVKENSQSQCLYCPNATLSSVCTASQARPCDEGSIFDHRQYYSTLTQKYSMVCGDSWKLELSRSLFMLGVLIGAGLFGVLSDKYGRRPIFLISAFLQVISFNLFPVIADASFYLFQIFQVFNGAIQYGTYLTGFIIIMELVQGFPRTVCGIGFQGYFAFGYIYVGICAYFIRDWKQLHWAVSAPSLLYIPYYWLLPESYRWDAVNGREERAKETVLKATRWNGIRIPTDVLEFALEPHKPTSHKILDLLRDGVLARSTLIVFFTWFVCSMTYYGLSLNTSDLPGSVYTNYLLSGVVELPGYVLCIPMMEYWGRKPTLVILFVVSGSCCIASGLLPHHLSSLIVTFAVVGKMCVAAAFAVIYNYSAELFPTVVRNAGTGFSSLCARIGSISAPQIHLIAHYAGEWVPIVIYGAFSITAGALDLFLPETKGKAMPETIEDGIRFCRGIKEDEVEMKGKCFRKRQHVEV